MKRSNWLLAFLLLGLPMGGRAESGALSAVFVSVTGQVAVKSEQGESRTAQKGSAALENERVITGKDGETSLKLFDGSSLELKPSTQLVVSSLRKPSDKEKVIRFLLESGGLRAMVEKLQTPYSLFEVEAGGVICGVRGTRFYMDYDADLEKLDLRVVEGTVYAKTGGKTYLYHAGEEMEFQKGQLRPPKAEGGPVAGTRVGASLEPKALDHFSPALEDLNLQFVQGFSLAGGGGTASGLAGTSSVATNAMGSLGTLNPNVNIIGNLHLPLKLP